MIALLASRVSADTNALLRGLNTDDTRQLSRAVAVIENAPMESGLADVLFAAGRATEDRLFDPARAFHLYERLVREFPDAGVSIAASRRMELLRDARDHAKEAAHLAQLIATADTLPPATVEQRANELEAASWPGAIDAMLFHADWLCRVKRFGDGQARYAKLIAEHPDAEQVHLARRNAAGCAIEAKDWALAEKLAAQLASGDEIDEAVRVDLHASIATGRRREWLYAASWIVLALAALALLASACEAIGRGGLEAPAWKPPVEVLYIGPVAVVIVIAAFAIDVLIAPAVIQISVAGLASAWVSGATLDLLRRRERATRVRSIAHVLACGLLVLAVGYIAMTRADLLDMLGETVKFGPGA